jgi:uncharacterized membrane protein YfcA
MNTRERHSRGANRIRQTVLFVCGALAGVIFGFYALVEVQDPRAFFGGLVVCSAMTGFLSARFGVRFWEMIRHLRWVPWL